MQRELILTEVGFCRLAALKYALELINEKEAELGLPLANGTARRTYGGNIGPIIQFVVVKGEQIQKANLLNPEAICIADPPPKSREEYSREWRSKNRARINAYMRRYYAEHRERVLDQHRAWKERNPEKIRAAERAWYRKRRDHCRARDRAWYVRNREKACASARAYKARLRDRERTSPVAVES